MGNISNYVRVLKAKLQDVFVIDSTDSNVTSTKSVTVEQIGDAICGEQVHSDLETDDKTIIGGINENKDKVGDLSELTTSEKSSLVGAVNEVVSNKTDKSSFTRKSFASTSPYSVSANAIDTQTIAINNATYGIVVGFAITNSSDVVMMQCFFNGLSEIQVRVRNLANFTNTYNLRIFYI